MEEVTSAVNQGRLVEAFGVGTAAVVSPVCAVGYNGVDIDVPTGREAGDKVGSEKSVAEAVMEK